MQPYDPSYVPETKYGGETIDPYAHYIPDVISDDTLEGEHISEYKKRQIEQEQQDQDIVPNESELKPMEP